MSIHVGSYGSLLSNDTKTFEDIVCLSEQEPHLWYLTKIQAWQELVFVLSAISKIESCEKASKLSFWGSDYTLWKNMLCCVYILTYAIDILCFIELLISLLSVLVTFWCVLSVIINAAVKHQKVTKTLHNVIDSSMRHKMSVAYVRIYTQQSIFFHELSLDHQNDNFEAFSRLSMLLIADNINTNSCQTWILVNLTNVAPAHSSIQYRQIFSHHLIEETYSYPHVWTFPESMLKYLYGGTFFFFFLDTHCRAQGGAHYAPTINLFATPRVFVRFSPNFVNFLWILLQIIWWIFLESYCKLCDIIINIISASPLPWQP